MQPKLVAGLLHLDRLLLLCCCCCILLLMLCGCLPQVLHCILKQLCPCWGWFPLLIILFVLLIYILLSFLFSFAYYRRLGIRVLHAVMLRTGSRICVEPLRDKAWAFILRSVFNPFLVSLTTIVGFVLNISLVIAIMDAKLRQSRKQI